MMRLKKWRRQRSWREFIWTRAPEWPEPSPPTHVNTQSSERTNLLQREGEVPYREPSKNAVPRESKTNTPCLDAHVGWTKGVFAECEIEHVRALRVSRVC